MSDINDFMDALSNFARRPKTKLDNFICDLVIKNITSIGVDGDLS